MSLDQAVIKVVNDIIQLYISRVSEKFELDQNELLSLWSVNTAPPSVNSENAQLEKLGKPELVELCKAKGIRHTGTKLVLIARLSGEEEKVSVASKKKVVVSSAPVIKKLVAKIPNVPIRRNQFGNYEHAETAFIVDRNTQKVTGKQTENGDIEPLTSEDINICNKYKFSYELPENLDRKTRFEDVQVEELDEEDEEFEEEEFEEEEEEEEEFEEEFEEEYEELEED